jgi:hypothetical protein
MKSGNEHVQTGGGSVGRPHMAGGRCCCFGVPRWCLSCAPPRVLSASGASSPTKPIRWVPAAPKHSNNHAMAQAGFAMGDGGRTSSREPRLLLRH